MPKKTEINPKDSHISFQVNKFMGLWPSINLMDSLLGDKFLIFFSYLNDIKDKDDKAFTLTRNVNFSKQILTRNATLSRLPINSLLFIYEPIKNV